MLVAFLILQLTALVLANPFHKYPYVFLLDVGNEELEKVNTEQIRISKQGGSLALRYPAIGNGEEIAHVRVSGIDFGTDLKANIVDGGPGYKYVVLILIGNPEIAFDAVITVQTVPSQSKDEAGLQSIENSSSNDDDQVSENNDHNDSAEDLNDSAESEEASQVSVIKANAELTQESSNVYSYAVNEALSGYGNSVHSGKNDDDEVGDSHGNDNNYDNDVNENDSEQKDIHVPYKVHVDEDNAGQFEDYTNNDNFDSVIHNQPQEVQHTNNDYSSVSDVQNYESDYGNQEEINRNLYQDYQTFKQNLYNGRSYYQGDSSETVYIEEPGDNESGLDLEDIFGDEYEDDDIKKYNSNTNKNNFIDRSDGSAVAY